MPFPKIPKIPDWRNLTPHFGDLLRDHRTLQGLSIKEVAAAAQIAPSALSEMEAGTRPAPPKKVVRALAAALNLTGEDRDDLYDAAELHAPHMDALFAPGGLFAPAEPEKQAPPPAAIFVFLIADIRGYTSYTERVGDEAAAQLSQGFAAMARAVFEQWHGRLVEVRGDEALGAFASARQALQAAADLHERYIRYAIERPGAPSGIGIGLDVGEAVPVDDGYRGAALNRAARLCSLAAPGETLVSPGIVYVAPHVKGVRFEARGQEYLKGFPEPVTILLAAPAEVVEAEAIDEPDESNEA
ncbi:MAG TPA: helix-turn-helix domain-containing protein [Ktedonobacterales bacterium]|jgi:class 3 adenylate cyclase|nr:helix-turn-helix domain-containing protein [Ktedonobacterales bacterium]